MYSKEASPKTSYKTMGTLFLKFGMGFKIWLLLLIEVAIAGSKYKVLLVSMDGFRWDYTDHASTPNFDAIARKGVKAPYINNTFTTKTFPCHYSIATGLYEESHGIVGNHMYDPVYDEWFSMSTKDPKWYAGGNPLWNEVQRHGLKSGVYFWAGSEMEIGGMRPNIYTHYNYRVSFKTRVDVSIDWLSNSSHGMDLVMLYFNEPDHTGHVHGPESQEVKDKVAYMDSILGYIIEKLNNHSLWSSVHLIVTSDHGMTDVDLHNRTIDLAQYVDLSAIRRMSTSSGPISSIEPAPGREDDLFKNLSTIPHLRAFKKQDIPEKWHYKNNRRILPIFILADEGWTIVKDFSKLTGSYLNLKGNHGYDNNLLSMRPIFYARGPNFKKNYVATPFNSVDIYPLVADLLGFTPSIPVNGTLDNVKDMLLNFPSVAPIVG